MFGPWSVHYLKAVRLSRPGTGGTAHGKSILSVFHRPSRLSVGVAICALASGGILEMPHSGYPWREVVLGMISRQKMAEAATSVH